MDPLFDKFRALMFGATPEPIADRLFKPSDSRDPRPKAHHFSVAGISLSARAGDEIELSTGWDGSLLEPNEARELAAKLIEFADVAESQIIDVNATGADCRLPLLGSSPWADVEGII